MYYWLMRLLAYAVLLSQSFCVQVANLDHPLCCPREPVRLPSTYG